MKPMHPRLLWRHRYPDRSEVHHVVWLGWVTGHDSDRNLLTGWYKRVRHRPRWWWLRPSQPLSRRDSMYADIEAMAEAWTSHTPRGAP